jgi:ABC-type Na+ efflux pump permease subunit
MQTRQSGVSLGGLLVVMVVVVLLAIAGLKIAPSYMEFAKAKSGILAIARERQTATVADIRKAFDARATIDDITAVKATDLEITKEGNQVVISFAYRKEIPFGSNVGLYFDFAATSKDQ